MKPCDPHDQSSAQPHEGSARMGPQYWRTLDELKQIEERAGEMHSEFPPSAYRPPDGATRRDFLKVMGASLALAGLQGCVRQPSEKIVPYVKAPAELTPGIAQYYATIMTLDGFTVGVLAESHEGRPTRIEGNPEHPGSLGACDIFSQAEILTLYDPDRSQVATRDGVISSWKAFLDELRSQLDTQRPKQGAGLRILTETVTSPTLAQQLRDFLKSFPQAKWHQYQPVSRDSAQSGAILAFGEDVNTVYRMDQADVVLSLDADFLCQGPGRLRYAHDFMTGRRLNALPPENGMNRLYVIECAPTLTGASADHRLAVRATDVERFARWLAARLGVDVEATDRETFSAEQIAWIEAVTDDLQHYRRPQSPGSGLVLAGEFQSPLVHALAHAMNERLGSVSKSVIYTEPVVAESVDTVESLRALVDEMNAGKVDVLFIVGGNPVFNAPNDLDFATALSHVSFCVHHSLYNDETSNQCNWHLPATHALEAWGDGRAFDGTDGIQQPLIEPLYDGKSAHELLSALNGRPEKSSHDIVQDYWKQQLGRTDFEDRWNRALHDGVLPDSKANVKSVSARNSFRETMEVQRDSRGIEVAFRPDPTIWDGRFANNAWLQELPKPFTKLTWDNAALVSPAMADELQLSNANLVSLTIDGRSVEIPIWVVPGHPAGSITVHFGNGRTNAGRVGTGAGFDAYRLRSTSNLWSARDVQIAKTGRRYPLATTQSHQTMENRDLVRAGTLEDIIAPPYELSFMHDHTAAESTSFYPERNYDGYKWGMSINLGACTGCSACVVACQAENNIPTVGKQQVANGREMHWLRVDTYYEGSPENPSVYQQPVPCMHCEHAPCEPVCPVAATTHSSEGLNEMTYNRCIGTRYCSNNCPYKVRRFNFLDFNGDKRQFPVLQLLENPNVTVRERGVMEKCTYCVQRINAGRIRAEKEDRRIRDDEVKTACQQACPAQAIVFGDMNDSGARVVEAKKLPLTYALLEELNTRPRTTYQTAVRNPNPKLVESHWPSGNRLSGKSNDV